MKKGVQMYTVRDYLGSKREILATLEKIKDIGYDTIQSGVPDCMNTQEYRDVCIQIGIENCSTYADYEQLLASPDAITDAIKEANILGVKDIAIATLPEHMRESKDGYCQFADNINRIAKEVKKEGKRLLYHPHALEFFSLGGGLKGMDIILSETDPDGLHFSFDTHWLASAGVSVTDWIYRAKGRMSIVHYKDYAIVGGAATVETVCRQFAEIGEGNLDWPAITHACMDTGVEFAIVEQDICPGNPMDSLAISYQNLLKFNA